MQDKFSWIATGDNDTTLPQINKDGTKNSYEDINRENLKTFTLGYTNDKGILGIFRANFNGDGNKLIWRRRIQKISGQEDVIVHVVGKKHQYVALIYQTGAVEIFDNFNEKNPLLVYPQMLSQEE